LDLAVVHFRNRTRYFLSPHFHGYVWGDPIAIDARLKSFRPGLAGMKGGKRESQYPTDLWASYLSKDPRSRKIINQIAPGKWFFGNELLPYRDQALFLEVFSGASRLDRICASGRGSRVRRQ